MTEVSTIATKTISELKGMEFYIPSYQRGYRWTKDEVRALLDDINEFSTVDQNRYCLQPLIVKKRNDGKNEVVDGQQRLTTIFIFMKIAEQEIRSAMPPYSLEFETRKKSADFLEKLSDSAYLKKNRDDNIDFSYIAAAYGVMTAWLDEQPDMSVAIQELNTKIRTSVFFIWYEIPESNAPTTIFTKVNLGKIPLTNSELIKAVLLNKDNFSDLKNEELQKRQLEISISWNRIEQGLQNDSFWYFLNDSDDFGTRIDLLFRLRAMEMDTEQTETKTKYFPFLVLSNKIQNANEKDQAVKDIWDGIEMLYSEFQEWYQDVNKYHLIGYLISSGIGIEEIFGLTRNKRKSEARQALIKRVENFIGRYDQQSLIDTSYENYTDKSRIRNILLLFNIITLIQKSEQQYRFPFDIYKKERWDIEHIHATADETDEPDNTLGNLTLLDAQTNRSYKDAPYQEKRQIILDREKSGLFVPLCTKNIFLKAYSTKLDDMKLWNESDKQAYVEAMGDTLSSFFKGDVLDDKNTDVH